MSQPFIGSIYMFAFNFAPRGYALCNGQTIAIQQNTALFSLLGTTYGGNGQTTFNLPNLQSRVAIHQGQGAGLSTYVMGQVSGAENVTLLTNQMPQHNHLVNASDANADQNSPASSYHAALSTGTGKGATQTPTYTQVAPDVTMAANMLSLSGGSQPHSNIQPYLTVNFCIALQGIFPSRN